MENWRRRQTSYDVARLLLMVPIEPWRNSTPFFGAVAFCPTKIDDLKTKCPCRSHIQRLHYPAFAAFFFVMMHHLMSLSFEFYTNLIFLCRYNFKMILTFLISVIFFTVMRLKMFVHCCQICHYFQLQFFLIKIFEILF